MDKEKHTGVGFVFNSVFTENFVIETAKWEGQKYIMKTKQKQHSVAFYMKKLRGESILR